jgi:hypothetical protein
MISRELQKDLASCEEATKMIIESLVIDNFMFLLVSHWYICERENVAMLMLVVFFGLVYLSTFYASSLNLTAIIFLLVTK